MEKMKIAFRIISEEMHGKDSNILPIIQHMCEHNNFKIGKIKEGADAFLYASEYLEDTIAISVQSFSEYSEALELFHSLIETLSNYYHQFEKKDEYGGYVEMEECLLEILKQNISEEMLKEKILGLNELVQVPEYYLLIVTKTQLIQLKDVIKSWEINKKRIS